MDAIILNSMWFSPMRGNTIGIVIIDNGYEKKAYIGTGLGFGVQTDDEQWIAKTGATFPLDIAETWM